MSKQNISQSFITKDLIENAKLASKKKNAVKLTFKNLVFEVEDTYPKEHKKAGETYKK